MSSFRCRQITWWPIALLCVATHTLTAYQINNTTIKNSNSNNNRFGTNSTLINGRPEQVSTAESQSHSTTQSAPWNPTTVNGVSIGLSWPRRLDAGTDDDMQLQKEQIAEYQAAAAGDRVSSTRSSPVVWPSNERQHENNNDNQLLLSATGHLADQQNLFDPSMYNNDPSRIEEATATDDFGPELSLDKKSSNNKLVAMGNGRANEDNDEIDEDDDDSSDDEPVRSGSEQQQQLSETSNPIDLSMAAGHHHHHHHGHYYQYAEVPKKKAWKFGYKRGNHKHTIERHEKGHKSHFHTKVKWDAKEKCKKKHKCHSVGKMTWDYNHDKKHHHHRR